MLLAGCTSLSTQPRSAWRALDPQAPLGAQDQVQVRKGPEVTLGPSEPVLAEPDFPKDRDTTRLRPERSTPILPKIPTIEPDEVTPGGGLELSVDAPERKQVGSHATYRVTIRNGSAQPAENVIIRCQFDEPLTFTGSDRREVVQRIDRLLPGEAKDLALSLLSDEVGSHCCRFTAESTDSSGKTDNATKSVCVQFVTRQLSIDMVGPARRTEGSRAEFNITLANQSLRTLTDLKAVLSFDHALLPREASAGAVSRSGSLTWDLGTLRPMESVQLQVDFDCRSLARRACISLEVKTAEIAAEHDEACLEVVPVPGTLDLRLSDRDDPIEVGKRGIYEITVHNLGLQPARQIFLETLVPEQFRVVSTKVLDGTSELAVRSTEDERRLSFDVIDELAANSTLTFQIEVEALRSGAVEFRAKLKSSLTSVPLTTDEPTLIVEP